jgi:hypothetical protein
LQTRDKRQVLQARDERAGVVKLVDALDSKSSEPKARVGSIPTSGTNKSQRIKGVCESSSLFTFLAILSIFAVFGRFLRFPWQKSGRKS